MGLTQRPVNLFVLREAPCPIYLTFCAMRLENERFFCSMDYEGEDKLIQPYFTVSCKTKVQVFWHDKNLYAKANLKNFYNCCFVIRCFKHVKLCTLKVVALVIIIYFC